TGTDNVREVEQICGKTQLVLGFEINRRSAYTLMYSAQPDIRVVRMRDLKPAKMREDQRADVVPDSALNQDLRERSPDDSYKYLFKRRPILVIVVFGKVDPVSPRIVQPNAFELYVSKLSSGQITTAQISSGQIGAPQIGVRQSACRKICANQRCAHHVASIESGTGKIGVRKIHRFESRTGEVGT